MYLICFVANSKPIHVNVMHMIVTCDTYMHGDNGEVMEVRHIITVCPLWEFQTRNFAFCSSFEGL